MQVMVDLDPSGALTGLRRDSTPLRLMHQCRGFDVLVRWAPN